MPKFEGAGWVKRALKVENMSAFGERVADLLGDLFEGIYHLENSALRKVEWERDEWMSVTLYGSMATFDGNLLTRLVVLCHDRMIRAEVKGAGPGYLKVSFSPRTVREGGEYWKRHPTMEGAVEAIRRFYGGEE
jgi:hypothetical protein